MENYCSGPEEEFIVAAEFYLTTIAGLRSEQEAWADLALSVAAKSATLIFTSRISIFG